MTTALRTLAAAILILPSVLTPVGAAQASAAQSKDLARLGQLLTQTGEKVVKEREVGWRANYEGDFTDSIAVFITTANGVIVITSVVDPKVPATHAMLVSLMRLSYDTDFAKLGLDSNQALIALTEADLATTDGPALQKLIRGVATLTDRTVGVLVGAPATLTFNDGRMSIGYSRQDWDLSSAPEDHTLVHQRGEAWVRVIAERSEIPTDRLTELAIENARKADPNLKVTARRSRTVNGIRMATLEMEAVIDQLPIVFYGHYYGGPEGAIQIIGWSSRNLAKEYRSTFERLADGFRVSR